MTDPFDTLRCGGVNVQGRVVLVTGAAKGIGKEVARQLAELGATVLISARNADHAQATAKELSPAGDVRALPVDLDVADDASVHQAAAALEGALAAWTS